MEYTLPVAIVIAAVIYGYSHMAAAKIASESTEEEMADRVGFETDAPPAGDEEE